MKMLIKVVALFTLCQVHFFHAGKFVPVPDCFVPNARNIFLLNVDIVTFIFGK